MRLPCAYDDLTVQDYPGHVVNGSLDLAARRSPPRWYRPVRAAVHGGLDRLGIIERDAEQIRPAVIAAIAAAPERFILGTDCTVPSKTSLDNLRMAIQIAHEARR